jgi:hypothetical protein
MDEIPEGFILAPVSCIAVPIRRGIERFFMTDAAAVVA